MHHVETTAERLMSVTSDNHWSKIQPVLIQFIQISSKLITASKVPVKKAQVEIE